MLTENVWGSAWLFLMLNKWTDLKLRKSSDSKLPSGESLRKPPLRRLPLQVSAGHCFSGPLWVPVKPILKAGRTCKPSGPAAGRGILQSRPPGQEADNWSPAPWLFNCLLIHSTTHREGDRTPLFLEITKIPNLWRVLLEKSVFPILLCSQR